ncbi:MAG: hypothetical protein ACOY3M_00415 [Patescibacteria group bacterium]
MRLSLKAISEFKQIYKNQFGVDLTEDEANTKGLELLGFFQYLSKPIPKENELYFLSLSVENGASNRAMYNIKQTDNNRL